MSQTHHRTVDVEGLSVFYRESGPTNAPVVLLLHGFPTSSAMYRNLIPRLSDRYRVIAPDYIGFGLSSAPPADRFEYTFDRLTDITWAFLRTIGVDRFAMVAQDYGAPIGWRLLLRSPGRVTAVISQNGNAYEDGFIDSFWAPIWRYTADRNPADEESLREALTEDVIRWQYVHGLDDPSVVDPDTWLRDAASMARPGSVEAQLALFADYASNRTLYPRLHEALRVHPIPVLAIWGARDEIFGPDGARAFARDVDDVRIELVPDGGHFLLESHLDDVAPRMADFLRHAESTGSTSPVGRRRGDD